MTANAMAGYREKCLTAGMDEYLSKPLRPDDLAMIMAKCLHQNVEPRTPGPPTLTHLLPASEVPVKNALPLPAINLSTLQQWEEMAGKEFVVKMANKFVEDATACVTAIEQAIDNHESIRLSETAHGLKGICRNMGADILAQVAYELEQASAGKLNREIPTFLGKICQEFQRVRVALKEVTSS